MRMWEVRLEFGRDGTKWLRAGFRWTDLAEILTLSMFAIFQVKAWRTIPMIFKSKSTCKRVHVHLLPIPLGAQLCLSNAFREADTMEAQAQVRRHVVEGIT